MNMFYWVEYEKLLVGKCIGMKIDQKKLHFLVLEFYGDFVNNKIHFKEQANDNVHCVAERKACEQKGLQSGRLWLT